MRGDHGPRIDRHTRDQFNVKNPRMTKGQSFDSVVEGAYSTRMPPDQERKQGQISRRNLHESMSRLDHPKAIEPEMTPYLDETSINIELEQGRSSQAGKL